MSRLVFFGMFLPFMFFGLIAPQLMPANFKAGEGDNLTWPSSSPNFDTIPPSADLALSKIGQPDPVALNTPLTYTLVITNYGQDNAYQTVLADALPANVALASVTISQGSCTGSQIVMCAIGTITKNFTVTATIVVTPTSGVSLTNKAEVVSFSSSDPNPADNIALIYTQVGNRIFLPLIVKT